MARRNEQAMLLRKAAYTSVDIPEGAGKMTRTQADRFIDMTINESVMFAENMVRVVRVDHRKGRINKLKFSEPVTYPASEGVEVTRTVKPVNSYLDYDTTKVCSAMDWTTELLELNVEGRSHEDTVMQALATQMGNDFEHLAISGDVAQYTGGVTAEDLLLQILNGWYLQSTTGTQLVNFGGSTISKVVFSRMIRAMPNVYKMQRSRLRFFCSPSVVQDYRDQLASRNTTMGDEALQGNAPLMAYGIPIVEVPLIPENLDSYDGSTAYGNGTFIWLTFPENFIWIISRDIEFYQEFKPRKDSTEYTLYSYIGSLLENKEAMVLGTDLRIQGAN